MRFEGYRIRKTHRIVQRLNRSIFRSALLATLLLSFAIELFQKAVVPFPVTSSIAFIAFIAYWREIPLSALKPLGLIFFLVLASFIVSPADQVRADSLRSLVYLFASIFVGLGAFALVRATPRNELEVLSALFAGSMLLGAMLEMFAPPVRALSDAYRSWNFDIAYFNDVRDYVLHGGIRPKFFTREPAHLGTILAFFSIIWLFTSGCTHKLKIFAIYTVISILLVRSPVGLSGLVFLLLYSLVAARRRVSNPSQMLAIVFLGGTMALGVILIGGFLVFPDRFNGILSGADPSAFIRIHGPLIAIFEFWSRYPFFGVGIGGDEQFSRDLLYPAYANAGIDPRNIVTRADSLLHNSIAEAAVSFGMIGFAFFIIGIYNLYKSIAKEGSGILLVGFFVISLSIGAFNSVWFWLIFFVLCGARRKMTGF